MRRQVLQTLLHGLVATIVVLTGAGLARAQETVRVRGALERQEGDVYVIKARDGKDVRVKLTANAVVVAIVKASLADIKAGSYVGVAGLPQADGSQKALEVHIFPEAMRGVGDGHRGWDLQPSSTMTNGNVEQATASAEGQVLKLKYKDGDKNILVPADAPIVQYMPSDVSELKAGARIFISAATKLPDGTLEASRVNVGRGVAPPM